MYYYPFEENRRPSLALKFLTDGSGDMQSEDDEDEDLNSFISIGGGGFKENDGYTREMKALRNMNSLRANNRYKEDIEEPLI